MARVKVTLKGHTTHSNPVNGECRSIVNLKPENGYKKPVAPRKVVHQLAEQYSIIFVHSGNNYENWIGVSFGQVYYDILGTRKLLAGISGTINSVQQIGNTLSFITDSNIYYALYKSSLGYIYLGEIPDFPEVKFSTTAPVTKSITFQSEYNQPLPYPTTNVNTGESNHEEIYTMTKGLLNVLIEQNQKEYFYDTFFIRYAYRLYDGSVIKHSAPILVMSQSPYKDVTTAYLPKIGSGPDFKFGADSNVGMKFFKLNVSYDFSSLSLWKDIIKSVDFFVTPYIGLQSPENLHPFFFLKNPADSIYSLYYPGFRGTTPGGDTPEDKALKTSLFYLYYSEDTFGALKTTTFPNADNTVGKEFQNIIYQERMLEDPFSHHKYGAKMTSVLNNRLRLIGLNTQLYLGHNVKHFAWQSSYNGETYVASTPKTYWVYTTIKTEYGEYIVRSGIVDTVHILGAMISYPDSRATKMKILSHDIATDSWYSLLTVELLPHPSLNIACAFNTDLKPFVLTQPDRPISGTVNKVTYHDGNVILIENNKIKVSELNNPFMFPNETTYHIGLGKILNESSIIMNVTDRNYGMYPVFVFTTDGVYTMAAQTPETVHASIQAPSYMEAPINDVLCPTPYGVAFVTQRGLMMISQHETRFISPELREDDTVNFFNGDGSALTVANLYPSVSFREYISGITNMVYNPYNDEMIISNSSYPYSYIYDFHSASFYISTEKIDQQVLNIYPKVFVCEKTGTGTNIKDYSQIEKKATEIKIVTRPLSFGTVDIKKLDRVILRAIMYNVNENVANPNKLELSVFYSDDSVNFRPAIGRRFSKVGNYRDFDLGLMARMKFRYYIVMLTGTVDDNSEIQFAEFEVDQVYNNEKMR